MYKQFLYKLYLLSLAIPLVALLIIISWKKETLQDNARICGLTPGFGFRIRIYLAMALDLLRFLHGRYGSPITTRPKDAAKLERLRSGPSLFLTAHFHNWEIMGAWLSLQGIPLLSAARPMAQGFSQSLLVRLRDRKGNKVLFQDIPRQALRHIQGGGCFGMLWDQRVPASKTRAPLFGRTLGMDPLPRFLIRHADLPVYFGVLLPGGSFRILQIATPRSDTIASSDSIPFSASGATRPGSTHRIGIPPIQSDSSSDSHRHLFDSGRTPLINSYTNPVPTSASPLDLNFSLGLNSGSGSPPAQGSSHDRDLRSASLVDPREGNGPDGINRLGRRYHRILECLVQAHPTSWYGLTHRRFLG